MSFVVSPTLAASAPTAASPGLPESESLDDVLLFLIITIRLLIFYQGLNCKHDERLADRAAFDLGHDQMFKDLS